MTKCIVKKAEDSQAPGASFILMNERLYALALRLQQDSVDMKGTLSPVTRSQTKRVSHKQLLRNNSGCCLWKAEQENQGPEKMPCEEPGDAEHREVGSRYSHMSTKKRVSA